MPLYSEKVSITVADLRPSRKASRSPSFFLGPARITVSAPAKNMSFCNSTPVDMNLLSYEGLRFNSNTTFFGIFNAKPHKLAPVIGTTKNCGEELDDSMVWSIRTM